METRKTAAVAGVLVIVGVVIGYAYVEGIGPLEEDPAAGLDEPPATENVYTIDSGDDGGDVSSVGRGDTTNGEVGTQDRDTPPFEFEVTSIEDCGRTCREVNAALHNRMDENAHDTVVYTWIYAGNTTDRDDVVWADNRGIDVLKAGGTRRSTDRVNLSVQQAENVRETDGWITVEATVESNNETAKFVTRENAG